MQAPPAGKRKSLGRRIVYFLLTFGAICTLLWVWSYVAARLERDRLIAELNAKGGTVDWHEHVERLKVRIPSPNGAEAILKAVATKPQLAIKVAYEQFRNLTYPTSVTPEIRNAVTASSDCLARLRELGDFPAGLITPDPYADLGTPINMSTTHSNRRFPIVLQCDTMLAREAGDVRRMYANALLGMRVAEQLKHEPFMVAQLIRIAQSTTPLKMLVQALRAAPPTEAEAAKIDHVLADMAEFSWGPAIRADRAMFCSALEKGPDRVSAIVRIGGWEMAATSANFFAWMYNRWLDVLASPLGSPATLRLQTWYMRVSALGERLMDDPPPRSESLERELETLLGNCPIVLNRDVTDCLAIKKHIYVAGERHRKRLILARLTLAVRRCAAVHGKLPESLSEVIAKLDPPVKFDWMRGLTPKYQPRADGFKISCPAEALDENEKRDPVGTLMEIDVPFEERGTDAGS